jgi:hypothetical protein
LLRLIAGTIHAAQRERLMTNSQEKRLNRIAERKGFRLDKAGHGKGHGRFYIMSLAEGGRMRSDVPDHEYSFSLEEAEAWFDKHAK